MLIVGLIGAALLYGDGGISHNEIEDAKPEDLTAGCYVRWTPCSSARGHGRDMRSASLPKTVRRLA